MSSAISGSAPASPGRPQIFLGQRATTASAHSLRLPVVRMSSHFCHVMNSGSLAGAYITAETIGFSSAQSAPNSARDPERVTKVGAFRLGLVRRRRRTRSAGEWRPEGSGLVRVSAVAGQARPGAGTLLPLLGQDLPIARIAAPLTCPPCPPPLAPGSGRASAGRCRGSQPRGPCCPRFPPAPR